MPRMDPCTGWTDSGPQPHYSITSFVSLQLNKLKPTTIRNREGTAAGQQQPLSPAGSAPEISGHRVPLPPCAENHGVPSGSGLSPLQPQGHRVNHSSPGREHSNLGPLPCEMSLLGNKEILCSRSIKGICVSLPTGTGPAQGKKSSSYSRGSSTGWGHCRDKGAISSSKARACPLPLIAPALPNPSAREATYQKILAGPQNSTHPPPQSPVSCQQSRA